MVKVSNENEVAAYHIIRIVLATIFTGYVVAIWVFSEYFSWANIEAVRIVGHIYALFYIIATITIWLRGGIWFVEFLFRSDVFEFKYYILTSPFGSKKMVRIPAENLYAFVVERSNLKLKKRLILFQEKEGKVFQYPPIPIGSFFADKQKQVIQELEKYGVKLENKDSLGR